MKTVILKLFRWQPSRETFVALVAGGVVLGLSAAMLPFANRPWVKIAIRDIGQIFLVGILLPLAYIQRSGRDWAEFGFSFNWPEYYVFLVSFIVLFAVVVFDNGMQTIPFLLFALVLFSSLVFLDTKWVSRRVRKVFKEL